jgi:hypothetical protein
MAEKSTKKPAAKNRSSKEPERKGTSKKAPNIKITQIREKARELGLTVPVGTSRTDLIRSIQRAEGYFDCFGTAYQYCDQFQCCWRSLCLVEQG